MVNMKTNRRKTSRRKYGGTTPKKTNLRRAERKTRRSTPESTPQLVVLGKIYSDQCIHCQNMSGAWEDMKKDLPDNYTVWDIESNDEEYKKKDFQQKHGVQLQSAGYPTIFMIVQGKQVDYNGSRDKDNLLQWARGQTSPATTSPSKRLKA
uniref:Thioredoxin domain-containing protein n=1 Tax=viral metagenome TaxID=1070528 RepID=A0A6C0ICE0_9ZZZZ